MLQDLAFHATVVSTTILTAPVAGQYMSASLTAPLSFACGITLGVAVLTVTVLRRDRKDVRNFPPKDEAMQGHPY